MLNSKIRNKKGSLMDSIIWVIIVFVVILFFAFWVYFHGQLTTELVNSPNSAIAEASSSVFTPINNAINGQLKKLALIIIFGMIINIFVSNMLVRANPGFYILYIFISVIGIIFSVSIANKYNDLLTNDVLGTTLQQFTGANFVMYWLPYFTLVIAIVGAILLFIPLKNEGGSPI